MGKWGDWLSSHLCLMQYNEILLQYASVTVYFSHVDFVKFEEGNIILLTDETP